MEPVPLVIVAPRLPPQACGIGTYAWQLNRYWPTDPAGNRFLVFADAEASREHLQSGQMQSFPPSRGGFAEVLERQQVTDVLLHYAGRAYHRFGFPRWMPAAFANWKKRDSKRRLHVIFHELPADLPLLSKQGILQRLSFPVARQLAELATTLITNSEHHASVLSRWVPRSAVEWFPVPSNIEPPPGATKPKRRGEFVIFGLPYTRLQAALTFAGWIAAWKKSGRLSRVHLIGPRDAKFTPQADAILTGEHVVEHGEVGAAQVSKLLLETEFCLSISNELTWSKSGAFMAYAAHGCAVVTAHSGSSEPLLYTVSAPDLEAMSPEIAERMGGELRRWYFQNADWPLAAARIAELVRRR